MLREENRRNENEMMKSSRALVEQRLFHSSIVYSPLILPTSSISPYSLHTTRRIRNSRRLLFVVNSNSSGNKNKGSGNKNNGSGNKNNGSSNNKRQSSNSVPSKSPYDILGVDPSCSYAQLKAAFRNRVKQFHPDVCRDMQQDSDAIIRRVIQAYEELSKCHHNHNASLSSDSDPDPFDEPECEANDVFVNEILCIGKGCPYCCVKRAPHAFTFTSEFGTARARFSQGSNEDDYDHQVQLAVGQCPRQCIHYVTPAQRAILEELLLRILDAPYDPAERAFLDSLIIKASYENKRYQKPKPMVSNG